MDKKEQARERMKRMRERNKGVTTDDNVTQDVTLIKGVTKGIKGVSMVKAVVERMPTPPPSNAWMRDVYNKEKAFTPPLPGYCTDGQKIPRDVRPELLADFLLKYGRHITKQL